MSIATEIKALERRIEAARKRGKLKEAGEMSRTLWDLKASRKENLKIKKA